MALNLQYGVTLRNNQLDQVEATLGASARLRIYTGTQPADCATAASGTLLVDMTLPADYMNAAATGSKTLLGTWTATGGAVPGTGIAGYFRLWNSALSVCSVQGTVGTATSDLIIDNTSINAGQTVNVTTFTVNAGNA